MEHTSLVQEELLAASDATSFMQALDSLLLQFASREGIAATPELSHQILRHADEIGLEPEAWIKTCIPLLESLQKKNLIDEAQVIAEQLEARLLTSGIISSLLVEALSRLSYLATIRRDFDHARELLKMARLHMTSSKDVDMRAFGYYLFSCGQLDTRTRKLDSAISNFETAATVYGLLGHEDNVALATGQKARAQMLAGYPTLARRFYSSAIDSSSSFRRQWITIAINYSICLLWLGEWDQAELLMERADSDSIELELMKSLSRVRIIRGLLSLRRNDLDRAASFSSAGLEIARRNGVIRDEIAALECLGEIEYERGNPAEAIKIYEQCVARGEAAGMSDATTEGKRREAEAWNALGEHDKALAAARRAIDAAETNEDRYEHAIAHRSLGVAHSMLGSKEAAATAFRQGIEEIRIVGDPFELAKTLVELARHLREWDPTTLDLGAAAEHLREAQQHFEKLGVEKWIRRVDEDIHEVIRLTESSTDAPLATGDSGAVRTGTGPAVERGGGRQIKSVTIITRAPELRDILERIARVAPSNLPVLITGESGTGKELFARALQELSGRPPDRFVAVNCAALPKELHESELFGHARGSFTGSTSEKAGLFELADGGTIFLDEIGDLDPAAQGKLLRVLENGELRRVGELKPRRVDARVVAATNRDLVHGAREGVFRGDLFHRLNGLPVRIPSLRERPGDIEPLVRHFLEFYQTQYKKRVSLPADLLELYHHYRWPGNVRELRQEIHRMVLLTADGTTIRTADSEVLRLSAGDEVTALAEASGLASAVGEHERRLILDALHRSSGNKAQAARLLNMSRTTLIGKIQRLGIE